VPILVRGATKFRELDSRKDSRGGSRSGAFGIRSAVEPASGRAADRCAQSAQIPMRSSGDGYRPWIFMLTSSSIVTSGSAFLIRRAKSTDTPWMRIETSWSTGTAE